MSKLLEHIQVYETNERTFVPQPLKMVDVEHSSYELRHEGFATVHRVIVKLGASVAVTDEDRRTVKWRELLKAKVYRPLAEEVFGEFRKPLLDADLAISNGDYRKASKLIHEVLDSMFTV